MKIHYIGLGKMGYNMVRRLKERGYTLDCYDKSEEIRNKIKNDYGIETKKTLSELLSSETHLPKTIWLMLPHDAVDSVLEEISPFLRENDTLIDGGNSLYTETMRRVKEMKKRGVNYLDAGISGGPEGAREGACTMIGGEEAVFLSHKALFEDISGRDAFLFVGKSGAGHFVKMVHNGIEYGMMQALAEGFDVLEKSPFSLDLEKIASLYNHRSVIESRLVGWLEEGYKKYGKKLKGITGYAKSSGEGKWTFETAKSMGIDTPVLRSALSVRTKSKKNPSYQGQIISVLRNEFGGHNAQNKNGKK
jgi:6-phosphogluconate dehydrogenase